MGKYYPRKPKPKNEKDYSYAKILRREVEQGRMTEEEYQDAVERFNENKNKAPMYFPVARVRSWKPRT